MELFNRNVVDRLAERYAAGERGTVWLSGSDAYDSQDARDTEEAVLDEYSAYLPGSHAALVTPSAFVGGYHVPAGTACALIDGVWYWSTR